VIIIGAGSADTWGAWVQRTRPFPSWMAGAGAASVVEAVATAAAAVIAAAIAFFVLDAPGFFFSLVKVRLSTSMLSRQVRFKRVPAQFEILLRG